LILSDISCELLAGKYLVLVCYRTGQNRHFI